MSRDDGFPTADIDTGYFDDAKLKDLWQRLRDPDQMVRAVVLHQATLLASWRQGCRVTVSQAAPLWLVVDEDVVSALRKVQLIDRGGRIPAASWREWFEVAEQRRASRRQAGAIGGAASALSRTTDGQRKPKHPLTDAEPVRPSIPAIPAVPTDSTDADPSIPDGDHDALDTYHELTGYRPWGEFSGEALRGAMRDYTNDALDAAIHAEYAVNGDRNTLLKRTLARLARDTEHARRASLAKPSKPRPVVDEAKRQAILRELVG